MKATSTSTRPGWVFFGSVALVVLFVVIGASRPADLARSAESALEFTTRHFGWLYLFLTTGFLLLAVILALSRYGDLRLGDDDEEPEFSYASWLGMIFSAGMGVGLVFWGVAEPLSHFVEPPLGRAVPRSPEAASLGLRYSIFHWGFHQWANFAIVGLAIAYVRFRRKRGGLISETFRPHLGHRVEGGLGHAIDILAVLSTMIGIATTLGLGAIQVNSGLSEVAGLQVGFSSQLAILAGAGVIFMLATLTPLERGVRYVSNVNMLLAAGILLFVFFAGPTPFITAAMTNTVGEYFANVVGMSLVMQPFTGEDWVERWTIFYWAWGVSWAPFVGSFIARISRGRTIREFLIGVIGVPVILSIAWFSTFGGAALYFEMFDVAGISDLISEDLGAALFATLARLPGGALLGFAAIVLVILFIVTSANSATFVLGMFTARGMLNPYRWIRLTWGGLQILVTAVLLGSGGLVALQSVSIVAAFPFMILMAFMAAALLRGLKEERRANELRERELRRRLERLVEDLPPAEDDR